MATKDKKIDTRKPRSFEPTKFASINTFLQGLPAATTHLFDIKAEETKTFVKLSADDKGYVKDVIDELKNPNPKILTHVSYDDLLDAQLSGEQSREVGEVFLSWGNFFIRNAMQAEAYTHQQSSMFEKNVDSAITASVQGAQMVKDKLVSNRQKREQKKVATRQANIRKKNETAPPK